ncbi:MAG: polysaccharide biosynthesis/export family protein [Candidatus Omnitrophota bacterium]
MRKIFFLLLSVLFLSPVSLVHAADYLQDNDPAELESSAKYNYYIGQYYYTQGRFDAAEQYFRRSRDFIEKRNEAISERRVKPTLEASSKRTGGAQSKEYAIGEGEAIRITVWQNDDLNQDVVVGPDGNISFPLIGEVPVLGLTITQLDKEITERLKSYIKAPEVSISVKKTAGSKVIVLGQVAYPGVYGVSGRKTILEAIALAGGFTNDAIVSSVILVRGGLENPQGKRLDLNKPLRGVNPYVNITLESEDIIFVPKKFVSDVNYFLNTVLGPMVQGAYTTQSYRNKRW